MRNLIFSLSLLIFFGSGLLAQGEFGSIVYTVTGKVKYAPSSTAKFKKLRAGTELAPEGMLKISPDAAVGIYYDEEYTVLNTAGEQSIQDITDNVSLFRESDVAEVFGEALENAFHPYFRSPKATRSGFATTVEPAPPPPKGTKDGHGNKEFKIVRIQPTGGKVAGNQITFRWKLNTPNQQFKTFKFVLSSADNQVLLEKEIKGDAFSLTSGDYQLEPGKFYKWQVTATENPEMSTPKVSFEAVSAADLDNTMNTITGAEMYQKADPASKLLMKASVLEQADFLAGANEAYEMAARQYKKNGLVQMMHKAFLWKYDLVK